MADARPEIQCFLELLENKITINGTPVPFLTQFYPEDTRPCVTLFMEGGSGVTSEETRFKNTPLDEDHPYYDEENPDEPYLQEVKEISYTSKTIQLQIWCNERDERDTILYQIKEIFKKLANRHYTTCKNYDPTGTLCTVTDELCDAITSNNRYGVQKKCPFMDIEDPEDANYRNPQSILEKYGIRHTSLNPREPTELLDLNPVPEEWRLAWIIDFVIAEEYSKKVNPVCDIECIADTCEAIRNVD